MEKEYMPYIGKNFEKSKYRILVIIDELKDYADFRKSKYDNYCHYLIEKNNNIKFFLKKYHLKKSDIACYNYRYDCKSETKLKDLKGKELSKYNNELVKIINELKPWKTPLYGLQLRKTINRKQIVDSGKKMYFEEFLKHKNIYLPEDEYGTYRKDGKQDPSLIKNQLLKLKSSLNDIEFFLKFYNPCIKSYFIYSAQCECCRKIILSPKDLDKLWNLSQGRYEEKLENLNIKICKKLGISFPDSRISSQLQYCMDYCDAKDCMKNALLIISELISEDKRNKTPANTKNEAIRGKCLMVYAKDKKEALDKIVDKYKEKYKLRENDFYCFNYIDKFDLLYSLKEKNCQNLTERPLSWYNKKLVKFIVENKPSTIVFLGGQLTKTISKNKIPSINKKIEEFLRENNISYFTEDLVTRENPSTKKDRLFQIKSLMENLQDDLNYLNPCNAAGELVLKNEKLYAIPESFFEEKSHDELISKYGVPDFELEKYNRFCNADNILQKAIRKVNEVIADDEELKKVNRMLLLLVGAFVPLPMFFELLDSFKDESDFNRIKKIITDRSSMIMYNVEFWEKYKDKEEYEKKKISSYNKRLNNFYTRLKEGHYVKDLLELMKERIFEENQIKKIKIYRDLSFFYYNADEYEDIKEKEEPIKEMIDKNRSALRKVKKDSDAAQQIKEKIDELRSQKDKIKEDIAIQRGDRPKEEDRNYILNRLWKPKNP